MKRIKIPKRKIEELPKEDLEFLERVQIRDNYSILIEEIKNEKKVNDL